MKLYFAILAILIFLLYFALLSGKKIQTLRFSPYKNQNVTVTMAPVGPTFKASSLITCAAQCVNYLQPCNCFMYNITSLLCTPGSFIIPSQTPIDSVLGKLYYIRGTFCDNRVLNFTVKTNDTVSACMWLSTSGKTYESAKNACRDISAHLYTMRVPQKLEILKKVLKPYSVEFWVGLDDLEELKVFKWADDNSVLDIDWTFWRPGEPNYLALEYCVHYSPLYQINDYICSTLSRYVCEISAPSN